ncbi:hypothetical protein B0H14DRAFT_3890761 [Mycena olivaceomarginata]|nr:hypothetical protein B0H14DRAFT_3890761 [Mycena olivaceomarginata]
MDPLTITTSIMTFASFINELIEVGENIRRSIEKVNENRRQIRELTEDVVRVLYDLAKLTKGQEDTFRGPELLSALESLKAEMLYVHSKCRKLSSVQLPGLRGVRSQFKAWRKRDDLEEKIGRLKEHVSKCYSQFMVDIRICLVMVLTTQTQSLLKIGQKMAALSIVQDAVALSRTMLEQIVESSSGFSSSVDEFNAVTLGRNDKALTAAQEAVKQELGANAFHALSLRLVTSGEAQPALLSAEKATELYRELVALAPRHLPTLASSLRNLGSILWDVGRRDEAIAACEEAVGIMQRVSSPETYFLPALAEALDQLAAYLTEKGDVVGASAAAAECVEVRREFAALPPEPEFLFEEVVDMVESDDEEEGWTEADEYHDASEGPSTDVVESDDEVDEYHDASEAPTSVEPLAFILESSGCSSTLTPGPSTDIDAPVQANPCGISIAAENSDIVVLNGSSAIESITTTDTVKSILSKPLEVEVS